MIGKRLKEERERLGYKQPEFADFAGAKARTLIDWEKGVSSPTAVQLSALIAIGVDAMYVLTGIRSATLTINDQSAGYSITPALSPREEALLDNYRHVDNEEDKKAIERVALRTAEAVQQQKEFEKQNWDGINRRKKAADK